MTQEQFCDKWKHELSGLILDAATMGLHGAELSVFLRGTLRKVDALLVKQYTDLHPKPAANGVAANGVPGRPVGVK